MGGDIGTAIGVGITRGVTDFLNLKTQQQEQERQQRANLINLLNQKQLLDEIEEERFRREKELTKPGRAVFNPITGETKMLEPPGKYGELKINVLVPKSYGPTYTYEEGNLTEILPGEAGAKPTIKTPPKEPKKSWSEQQTENLALGILNAPINKYGYVEYKDATGKGYKLSSQAETRDFIANQGLNPDDPTFQPYINRYPEEAKWKTGGMLGPLYIDRLENPVKPPVTRTAPRTDLPSLEAPPKRTGIVSEANAQGSYGKPVKRKLKSGQEITVRQNLTTGKWKQVQ